MPRAPRPALRFEDLPLFADDAAIAEAIVGRDEQKARMWKASLPDLEARGFPKAHGAYGRYTPAVRQFYDDEYGRRAAPASAVKRGAQEDPGSWHLSPRERLRRASPHRA